MKLAVFSMRRAIRQEVPGVELSTHLVQTRRQVRASREPATSLTGEAPQHELRLVRLRVASRAFAWIDRVDRDVVAICRPLDITEIRQRTCHEEAWLLREPLADQNDCRPPRLRAKPVCQRTHRREDDLGAGRFGECRGASHRLLLERRTRRVVAGASLERGDGGVDSVAVSYQADRRQRIERLEHDDEILGPELFIHEPGERLADSWRVGFRNVKLVQQQGQAVGLRRSRLARFDVLDDRVVPKLEILRRQAPDRFALAIRHGNDDAHGPRLVLGGG
jgi:hypothetical protein